MKKFRHLALLLLATVMVFGCSKYDDTELRNDVNDLQSRVTKLEKWCETTNGQISALQGLVTALEAKDFVTGVSPIVEGGKDVGYTITFSKSGAISIYNGKDGAKGADGVAPIIGVDKDADGHYYWTIKIGDGEATWMKDASGNNIRTTGDKGADGETGANGKDGHTPVLSVDTFEGKLYWKVDSKWLLNNGQKVQVTGDKGDTGATGDKGENGTNGTNGSDGDAIFAKDGIDLTDPDNVTFTLADGTTKITLPRTSAMQIFDSFDIFTVQRNGIMPLALNVKKGSYSAIKAEITNNFGINISIIKATRAASTPWGVTLSEPTFNSDATIDVNGKVAFTFPAGIDDGEFALLKVTVIDNNGQEHTATRVVVFSSVVNIEKVELPSTASIEVGGTTKLIPIFTPADATNKTVTWTSSNTEVATIAADGTVTGVAIGETTITVTTTDGNKTAICKVTVNDGPTFENESEAGIDGLSWEKAYTIKTKKQLALLATRINGNDNSKWNSKYYKLISDIDFGDDNTE